MLGHGVRAVEHERGLCTQDAAIDPQFDIGVEPERNAACRCGSDKKYNNWGGPSAPPPSFET
jgi:hypothetical protein